MSNEPRTRRLCWIALVVLLPLALWTHAYEDATRAWRAHASKAIDVDARQTISFAGLNWSSLGYDTTWNPKDNRTVEIVARVQLDVPTPSALKELGNCWPYLEDSSGQRWSRRPPRSGEISCARLSLLADPEIKQTVLEERFVIPAARASEVRLAFVIPKHQPQYLLFWRPEETPHR